MHHGQAELLVAADECPLDEDSERIAWPFALGGDKGYRADWIDQYLLDLDGRSNVVHIRHRLPADVVMIVNEDMFGGFCHVTVYGTENRLDARFAHSFSAFNSQLQACLRADGSATSELLLPDEDREHGRPIALADGISLIGRVYGWAKIVISAEA